jgi:hypothetical protein
VYIQGCVNQDTESLARLGMEALSTLMLTLGVDAETEEVGATIDCAVLCAQVQMLDDVGTVLEPLIYLLL